MHGLKTIEKINREYAEANAIMKKHEAADAAKRAATGEPKTSPYTEAVGKVFRQQ